MNDGPRSGHGTLPLAMAQALDRLGDRFEQAWQKAAAGEARPRLEDYAAEVAEELRPYLLRELIPLDVAYRRRHGEQPRAEEYLARFPDLDPAWLAEPPANGQEPAAPPTPEAGAEGTRPPRVRCPQCHNPIQLADTGSEEVLCPGCGSAFRICDARQTTTTGAMRPLGKFQLLERVGLGAFGAVWRARDTVLDRVVALKIPHTGLLTSEVDLERFHREARAAAQLRHPGIVTVHEVQTLDGLPVIVADFIRGVPLRDLLEVRPLTFREAAALLADVAEAVDYAHGMGLVHRDLKPANIMIESPRFRPEEGGPEAGTPRLGRPLVMDFGLALRDEAEITMTLDGHILGTPAYMSPEQAAGQSHQADRRSDVYSLGVILYQLLTDELPFRGSKAMLLHQVQHEEPRPPRKINDKVPRDLETICLKALAKAPARRYQTARELADDLRRFLNNEPIQARPVGHGERSWRWCRRNPLVAALAVAVVASLVAGTVITAFFAVQASHNAAVAQQKELLALAEKERATTKAEEATQEKNRADANARQAFANLYVADMNLAQNSWEENNIVRVRDLVERYREPQEGRPELRNWEWYYLDRLCHAELLTLKGHLGAVRDVVFSPDGMRLASAGSDRTVRLWDAANGRLLHSLGRHRGVVLWVAFSPDGARLATAGQDRTIRVWGVANGQQLHLFQGRQVGWSRNVVFSPDGSCLAAAMDGKVWVWHAVSGETLHSLEVNNSFLSVVVFSPEGSRLACAGAGVDGKVSVWNMPDGSKLHSLGGETRFLRSVVFSPDGTRLAAAGSEGTVEIWDMLSGRKLRSLKGGKESIADVVFSPDLGLNRRRGTTGPQRT